MIGILTQIGEAIMTIGNVIIDFFVGFVKWIPIMIRFTSSSAGAWAYVPSTLLPVAVICCTFFCLSMLIHGGMSK